MARNALRHGLAIAVRFDPALDGEIEEFAKLIAGKEAQEFVLNCARRIAEAQIDLRRIRQVRLSEWSKSKVHDLDQDDFPLKMSEAASRFDWPMATADSDLAKQLVRLDRYERRAFSRRKAAVREFYMLLH